MPTVPPRVFNIAPGGNFLEILAKNILDGFPLNNADVKPPLSNWTILLPTRRAARQLGLILLKQSGQKAIILPRIRPIGDFDDETPSFDQTELPLGISPVGHFLTLFSLVKKWSNENPVIELAQEISKSPAQIIALTNSLLQLLNQAETEEISLEKLNDIYDADLSEHRHAILSLLSTIKIELPKTLHDLNLLGPQERRSRMIRMEAERIRNGQFIGPIVAAGSTGTIPATRELLKAVANHRLGAVILPGLDDIMEEVSWVTLKPDHPQFALKKLIDTMEISRAEIPLISAGRKDRNFLTSELMRPTEHAHLWRETISANGAAINSSLENLHLIQAPDMHIEARTIALILRNALETPNQTAALVTPSRDLAKRVKAELQRWNIAIDDTASEPLTKFGMASLAKRLAEASADRFSTSTLLSLLHHPDCRMGLLREDMIRAVRNLEIAVFRNYGTQAGVSDLILIFERARMAFINKQRAHILVSNLQEEDWYQMHKLVLNITNILTPLLDSIIRPFSNNLELFFETLSACAPTDQNVTPENLAFDEVRTEIEAHANVLQSCDFATACTLIINIIQGETFKNLLNPHPRLAIYGLLEARMMPADILVMGGLNETKWPAQPDPGPWVNRPMRDIIGLQQPEREIGVSAHDFTQGFGYAKVYITYSKRVDGAPLVPSRWILRLQAILQIANLQTDLDQGLDWLKLAKSIDDPGVMRPIAKPKPKPKLEARPKRISVTEVEKLIRDPYGVYARRILRLEPLPDIARKADPALRGTLFHEAIGAWNERQISELSTNSLDLILKAGAEVFAPFSNDPEITSFWWPRFQKMANWLVENERDYRANVTRVHTELSGELEFEIANVSHLLYGRADRMDILTSGQARIIDYKTGEPPSSKQVTSGLSPQLPLEAAILAEGKFGSLKQVKTETLDYIHISGGGAAGEVKTVKPTDGSTLSELSARHLLGLKSLLTGYTNSDQSYIPRVAPKNDEDELEYDHLSRFKEWLLGGRET
jgi:ATP-dependent helicase/nuclease subunit B